MSPLVAAVVAIAARFIEPAPQPPSWLEMGVSTPDVIYADQATDPKEPS